MKIDECQVWWVRVEGDTDRLEAVLGPEERERWGRLRHRRSRARYVVAHAAARAVCGRLLDIAPAKVRFTATCRHCGGPHGRPGVDVDGRRLRVSLSHSGDRAAVALAWDTEVGVDLETVAVRGRIPLTALAEAEREHLDGVAPADRVATFIRYWTRKEAVLKATGDGLVVAPRRVTVSAPEAPPAVLGWADRPPPHSPVFLTDLRPWPGYHASLATLDRPLRLVEADATPLLSGI